MRFSRLLSRASILLARTLPVTARSPFITTCPSGVRVMSPASKLIGALASG